MEKENLAGELLTGCIDTIILKLLMESDSYGYQIVKHLSNISDGMYELKEATLYSCLKRLEKNGDITFYWGDETNGGRRKYYTITDIGKRSFAKHKGNWEFTKQMMERMI